MEAAVLTILLFCGVIAITALIFGAWVIVSVARLFFRIIGGIGHILLPSSAPLQMPSSMRTCQNSQCRANNPQNARFCRRCGKEIAAVQPVHVRRAAMW